MSCFSKIRSGIFQIIVVLWILIAIIQPSYAISIDNVPQPLDTKQNYIVDLANVLDKDTEVEINQAIANLQRNKNKTIYIVTVPFISDTPTQKVFKIVPAVSKSRRFLESILLNWNLESLKQGNGILILTSIGDRSIEIRSASNLKYIIQDRHIQGIIDKIMLPKFKQNDYAAGVLLASKAIIKKVNNPYYNSLPNPESTPWQSKLRSEFKLRNIPSSKGSRSGYDNYYPSEISYYGGSSHW